MAFELLNKKEKNIMATPTNTTRSHFLLEQLKRDAAKKGAWQAKVALVNYYLTGTKKRAIERSKENDELASKYLEEVIEAQNWAKVHDHIPHPYATIAKQLQCKLKGEENAISKAAVDLNRSHFVSRNIRNLTRTPSENQYKTARFRSRFGNGSVYTSQQYEQDLKGLLESVEITDTLQAKIYFQLIHINLEKAKKTGHYAYLQTAYDYSKKLTQNPCLSGMEKAEKATKIMKELEKHFPKAEFSNFLREIVSFSQESSKIGFKWLGILIGNIANLSLFPPLFFNKASLGYAKYQYLTNSNAASLIFKNSGFAWLFKNVGKLLGKYVFGNIFAAFAVLFSLPVYPLLKMYKRNTHNAEVTNIAILTMNLRENSQSSTTVFEKNKDKISHIDQREFENYQKNHANLKNIVSYDFAYQRVTQECFPEPLEQETTLSPRR